MKALIEKPVTGGTVKALPSKSMAHRLLIASALSSAHLEIEKTSDDIEATRECLEVLLSDEENKKLYCKESGSTFRFLLPLAGVLGIECDFFPEKSLVSRPIWPLYDELVSHGCEISNIGNLPIHIKGKLKGGAYQIPGSISSQYITALLMALPLAEENSTLEVMGRLESEPYVDMTLQVLKESGIVIRKNGAVYEIPGGQKYILSDDHPIEGDWSNAAFWFSVKPFVDGKIDVTGLDKDSVQGDKEIEEIVSKMYLASDEYRMTIDVSNIPDLVPAIAVAAAGSDKEVDIINAQRLRLKESDRINSVIETINQLGGQAWDTDTGLAIRGCNFARGGRLLGGRVDSFGDHRIAMMAAALSSICKDSVIILNPEVVTKSYPTFFDDFERLGGTVQKDF